jgi:hypothetical protein
LLLMISSLLFWLLVMRRLNPIGRGVSPSHP